MVRKHSAIRNVLSAVLIAVLCSSIVLAAPPEGKPHWSRTSGRYDFMDAVGISGIGCNCTKKYSGTGPSVWIFREEPVIDKIEPGSPADGILREGDVIVAIDGMLITTRRAGRRFGRIEPGEKVELTIRRGKREITYSLVAMERTTEETPEEEASAETRESTSIKLEDLSEAVERLAEYAEQVSQAVEIEERGHVFEMPELPELEQLNIELESLSALSKISEIHERSFLPEGTFGFGLTFAGTIRGSEEPPQWEFDSPPTVYSVDPDGPADRAGMRRGDILTHIDGVRIDSERGGILFSAVEPNQTVEWTIHRKGDVHRMTMTATEREARPRRIRSSFGRESRDKSEDDVRFTGTVGGARIEVYGSDEFQVTVSDDSDVVTITTPSGTVHVRRAED